MVDNVLDRPIVVSDGEYEPERAGGTAAVQGLTPTHVELTHVDAGGQVLDCRRGAELGYPLGDPPVLGSPQRAKCDLCAT
jgi:hypothetical protein